MKVSAPHERWSAHGGATGSAPLAAGAILWEGCSSAELAQAWSLPRVVLHDVVDSTNDVARALALAGAPHGTAVIAESQRAGRGRVGRAWSSPPGVGLWVSLIFRDVGAGEAETLPIQLALEASAALDSWLQSPVMVKWPNDLLIGGRKVGGILCESAWEGARARYLVAGIGLNLLQGSDDFPPSLRESATSLRLESDRDVSRFEVASALFDRLVPGILSGSGATGLLQARFDERDALRDREIDVLDPGTGSLLLRGRGRGIDTSGALLVESPAGTSAVRSGSVRLSPTATDDRSSAR